MVVITTQSGRTGAEQASHCWRARGGRRRRREQRRGRGGRPGTPAVACPLVSLRPHSPSTEFHII